MQFMKKYVKAIQSEASQPKSHPVNESSFHGSLFGNVLNGHGFEMRLEINRIIKLSYICK